MSRRAPPHSMCLTAISKSLWGTSSRVPWDGVGAASVEPQEWMARAGGEQRLARASDASSRGCCQSSFWELQGKAKHCDHSAWSSRGLRLTVILP